MEFCDFCLRERRNVTKGTGRITTVHICHSCAVEIAEPDAQEMMREAIKITERHRKEREKLKAKDKPDLLQRLLGWIFGKD